MLSIARELLARLSVPLRPRYEVHQLFGIWRRCSTGEPIQPGRCGKRVRKEVGGDDQSNARPAGPKAVRRWERRVIFSPRLSAFWRFLFAVRGLGPRYRFGIGE